MDYISVAKKNFREIESTFSEYATKSSEAIRFKEIDDDIRTPFFKDIDKMIHSISYSRYTDKTQVFSFFDNDHISRRMLHVQLVSKIARTIGRALKLNTDLIEAIALGHDIGHTPLGHVGESLLNEISMRELNECFLHNIQGVRHYMEVENNGRGLNLTIQVLDGIMCHNGEILSNKYYPQKKSKQEFLKEYYDSYLDVSSSLKNRPMTLEGCVVRISDIIGYIGRDIEDALELGKLKRDDIPDEIVRVLGNSNKDIVNTIIMDIIKNSLDKPYICLSSEVYDALFKLKEFNYKYIYSKSIDNSSREYYRQGMNKIYDNYLTAIKNGDKNNIIFKIFLNRQDSKYLENTKMERQVIDFIAGMTDDLFLGEVKRVLKEIGM